MMINKILLKSKLVSIILILLLFSFSCTSIKTEFITFPYHEEETIYKKIKEGDSEIKPSFEISNLSRKLFIGTFQQSVMIEDTGLAERIRKSVEQTILSSNYWFVVSNINNANYSLELYIVNASQEEITLNLVVSYPNMKLKPWSMELKCPPTMIEKKLEQNLLPSSEKMIEQKVTVTKYNLEKKQTKYFDTGKALLVVLYIGAIVACIYLASQMVYIPWNSFPTYY